MHSPIPIVFATDENYAPYVYATMLSCLETKKESTFYEFYIMTPTQFRTAYVAEFMRLPQSYRNCSVRFVDMKNLFKEANIAIAHIATPTYYRLVMASKLNNCDKAIYLDADVIVKEDLTEYFEQDISDYCVGGVKAIGYILNKSLFLYYKELGLHSVEGYINAGVTLWNLKKIRELNLESTLLSMAAKGLKSMDQDAINITFKDKIKILPLKYNMMTKYMVEFINLEKNPEYARVYGADNIKEAIEQPIIIHYADKIKPWQDSKMPFAVDWWATARQLPFLFQHEIILKNIGKMGNIAHVPDTCNPDQAIKELKASIKQIENMYLAEYYTRILYRYRLLQLKCLISWGKKRESLMEQKKRVKSLLRKTRDSRKAIKQALFSLN